MNTSPLSERAMLASLNIRRWQAARTDKKITSEVAAQHAVKEKRAGKYRKNAIDVEAPSFVAVGSAAGELRTRHYFFTLPWSQDGSRILPSAMFVEYSEEMRKLRISFDRTVKAFIDDYPTLKSAARLELNGMYNEQDYPDNISAKFGLDIVIMPLPDSQDFRASLSASAVAEIKEGIAAELQHSLNVAMRDPYERLYSHISRMVDRLSDKKGVVRDTLITGLADLCAILPGLNLTSDPKLDELRKRAEKMIAGVDPQDLREVPSVRRDVARQAAEIQNMMASFMGVVPSAEAK
jgi:hypothetical protein